MAQPNPNSDKSDPANDDNEADTAEQHATKTDNASQPQSAVTAATTATKTTTATETTPTRRTSTNEQQQAVDMAALHAASVPGTPSAAVLVPPKKTQNDFVFGKCIGEGSFSTVYLAADKCTQREYAIKVCDKRHILREGKQEYVRREREVLQLLSNVPGFLRLMCTFQDSRSLFFVVTYATNGELLPYIKRMGCFSPECARHYAAELVLACEQMHRRNIVHRDLKPENILVDKGMHTLIADFGSAKILTSEDLAAAAAAAAQKSSSPPTSSASSSSTSLTRGAGGNDDDDDDNDEAFGEPSEREAPATAHPSAYRRKRRGSFVGTAQYVSPEVLEIVPITPAADLWALGCILYQMVAGLPPFRGYNDLAIFKEILACKLSFPPHFDAQAEQLVKQLLQVTPADRLGAQDDLSEGRYVSIRAHPFFAGIDFERLREQTPPKMYPFLPSLTKDDIERLKVESLGTALEETLHFEDEGEFAGNTQTKKKQLLEKQKTDKWHPFAEGELILHKGYVNKHKGLFAQKRMLLLTTGPRLIYIDPVEMIRSGEVPWSDNLHVELINSKVFFVHTMDRTYFFDVLEDCAKAWAAAIERLQRATQQEVQQQQQQQQQQLKVTTMTELPTPQMCSSNLEK